MPEPTIHDRILRLFGGWSTARIARFLGVNARTIQRWLKEHDGQVPGEMIPDDLRQRIDSQLTQLEGMDLPGRLDDLVDGAKKRDIDAEIIGAHLARAYWKLTGRDIE